MGVLFQFTILAMDFGAWKAVCYVEIGFPITTKIAKRFYCGFNIGLNSCEILLGVELSGEIIVQKVRRNTC